MSDRRTILVTGASSGIGAATARRFAAEGWDVCLQARRETLLEQVRASLPAGNHVVAAGDYSDPVIVDRVGTMLKERWGGLHALVNCAGVTSTTHPIDTPIEHWREVFETIFNGAVYGSRMAAGLMADGGRVVHVTSIHGERVEVGSSSYAVAKAALNQYCRALALELASRNILVNAIAPGFVDTPMSVGPDGVNELHTEWFRKNYVDGHHLPLKRAASPAEIAGVAYFLAGPDASYITGQVITVDGGLTITF